MDKPSDFSIDIELDASRAMVAAIGEIDIATVPQLDDCIEELVARGVKEIELDLRQVAFMDSQGISFLVITKKLLDGLEGGRLAVVASDQVKGLMRITRLDAVIDRIDAPEAQLGSDAAPVP